MKRIIIKIGTNLLTDHHQRLDLNNMRHLTYQIAEILSSNSNVEFLLVSSGAITSGAKHINISPDNLAEKQAAASIGQILLFQKYYEFFQSKNHCVGQLLVTKDNFEDENKKQNIQQTIETLLSNKVIPIINENDSVSTEEIQFGDNDQLSAILATNLNANQLIILTNTDGVLNQNQDVITHLNKITDTELNLVDQNLSSPYSKGGMKSKLLAAKTCLENNIEVVIANGRTENIIQQIVANEPIGTKISSSVN
ncbi:MAG: glutamate 5-kinase [Candidatus Margulisiibacteriota bacterium]